MTHFLISRAQKQKDLSLFSHWPSLQRINRKDKVFAHSSSLIHLISKMLKWKLNASSVQLTEFWSCQLYQPREKFNPLWWLLMVLASLHSFLCFSASSKHQKVTGWFFCMEFVMIARNSFLVTSLKLSSQTKSQLTWVISSSLLAAAISVVIWAQKKVKTPTPLQRTKDMFKTWSVMRWVQWVIYVMPCHLPQMRHHQAPQAKCWYAVTSQPWVRKLSTPWRPRTCLVIKVKKKHQSPLRWWKSQVRYSWNCGEKLPITNPILKFNQLEMLLYELIKH